MVCTAGVKRFPRTRGGREGRTTPLELKYGSGELGQYGGGGWGGVGGWEGAASRRKVDPDRAATVDIMVNPDWPVWGCGIDFRCWRWFRPIAFGVGLGRSACAGVAFRLFLGAAPRVGRSIRNLAEEREIRVVISPCPNSANRTPAAQSGRPELYSPPI